MPAIRLPAALGLAALLTACQTGSFPDYPDQVHGAIAAPAPAMEPPPLPPPPPVAPPRELPGIAPLSEDEARPYVDRQEAELRYALRDAGIRIARERNTLTLIIDEDILFAHDSAAPTGYARETLRDLALVLRDYRATYIDVDGFTDTTGGPDYNLRLSEMRAANVADLLMREGVAPARVATRGHGERNLRIPTADGVNEPLNRRVEITLEPYVG